MNEWGYVITGPRGIVYCEDFGYETEADAEKYGLFRLRRYRKLKVSLTIEQHWRDL